MRKKYIFLLATVAMIGLSGCTKDKPKETTTPTLEVIKPEETTSDVLESAPVKESETRKAGDGKSLEELSEEDGIPIVVMAPVENESLLESNDNSTVSAGIDKDKSSSEVSVDNKNKADTSDSSDETNLKSGSTSKNGDSAVDTPNIQGNNGGDTEVVGIDQEAFNEMQDKYREEANEVLNDPEQLQELLDMMK